MFSPRDVNRQVANRCFHDICPSEMYSVNDTTRKRGYIDSFIPLIIYLMQVASMHIAWHVCKTRALRLPLGPADTQSFA